MTLLAYLVLDITHSPLMVALVGFSATAPMLLLGVFGGLLADRLNRHHLMLTTQTINFCVALGMTVLLITGAVKFWHCYLIIMVIGACTALDSPSRRSMIHDLSGRSRVTNAIALDSVGVQSSKMLGPILAGLFIFLTGVQGGYIVVSAFYLISVFLLRTANLPPRIKTVSPVTHITPSNKPSVITTTVFRNLREGFTYVSKEPVILGTVLVTFTMNLLLFSYNDMMTIISVEVLKISPVLMGVLIAMDGFGALLGSAMIASTGRIIHHGRVFLIGSALALVCLLLLSFSNHYHFSLIILLFLGFGVAGFATMQTTIIMLTARTNMRGRALGLLSLAIGAGPIGSLLVGSVANVYGPQFAIRLTSCIGISMLITIAILMPSLRKRMDTGK